MDKTTKLTPAKLRKIAKLTIAIHAFDFQSGGLVPTDIGMTEEEFEVWMGEVNAVASKLAGNHPMHFGSVGEIVQYFKKRKGNG